MSPRVFKIENQFLVLEHMQFCSPNPTNNTVDRMFLSCKSQSQKNQRRKHSDKTLWARMKTDGGQIEIYDRKAETKLTETTESTKAQ